MFFAETSMRYDILPDIKNYKKYADPSILQQNHGCVIAYIQRNLVSLVFDVTYNEMFHLASF